MDAASGHIDIQFQSSLTAQETIQAVKRYEAKAYDKGIIVQEYQSDNGTAFISQEFRQHLLDKGQTSRFSGAGSHHQNGRAERGIRTIRSMARTMMLHSAIHWLDVADATLWPMAVNLAVYIYNHVPNRETGLATLDLWSKTRTRTADLMDLHVFGCPIYALKKSLADGKLIPQWDTRASRGMYVGQSTKHANSVP